MEKIELTESKPLEKKDTLKREKKYEFFINDNEKNKSTYRHKDNSIDTTKYNAFTFLPKALLFQFFRLANIYFLFIAIIQSIDIISPLGKETAWAPLAFVLCVSLIREAVEDLARRKYDRILNSEPVMVYKNGEWKESKSGELRIGEIVVVKEDSSLPADMVLLDSSAKEGIAFIETGTLDGEKTLKQKISPKDTAEYFNTELGVLLGEFQISGSASSDLPNPELYSLDCKMHLTLTKNSGTVKTVSTACDAKQLLLKGALLRNTKWVVGFVVYTGHNNKLILNSKKPRMKYSRVEYLMSRLLIVILILQTCFCILCAAMNSVYYKKNLVGNPFAPPLQIRDNPAVDSLISYFTYILLLNTMIPISLIITLEIAKMVQGYFLSVDALGYSHVRKKFIKAASVSLNEELGQVNFIFSDKTGTLTCNKMEYKYGVIGDVCYEYVRDPEKLKKMNENGEESKRLKEEEDIVKIGKSHFSPQRFRGGSKYPNFTVKSDKNENVYLNMDTDATVAAEYWKALSICHQCEIEEKENGEREYTGLSPDDIELVKTASAQGYDLLKSPATVLRRVNIGGEMKQFDLLHTLEFDSTRKRMSVVIRDNGMVKLYIKGADTAVEWIGRVEEGNSRLSPHSNKNFLSVSKNYVDYFSTKGYRTLLVGMKILDEVEYEEWSRRLHEANMQTENKQKAVDDVYAEIEKNIYILGSTIVEDKLQDQVPETIRDLRLAGIKIWMLTGDKMDTAYNIGLSCNLISHELKIFKLHGEKGDRLNKLVTEYEEFKKLTPEKPFSILIDAVALSLVLDKKENINQFLEIAYFAVSVICCRVSPLQKSDVVRIMKEYDAKAVTLSVGDGGNDVSMIMEAHIGVGMYGEEGMRAVQSGDYAIGEFKILRRLLLFHGRTNNIRVSKMILYFFYKNFVFTITHFYYAFYNNCTGQTIIDDWFITFYNLLFTAFPLGVMAVLDFDVKVDDGEIIYKLLPFLYKENNQRPIFTKWSFVFSLFRGIIHGIINFIFLVFTLGIDNSDSVGNMPDLWFFSVSLYTNIIFIVSMRIIIILSYHTIINWGIMAFFSWILYVAFVIVMHFGTSYNSVATMFVAFSGGKFYFNFVLVVGTCAMIDLFTSSYEMLFSNSLRGELQILVKQLGSLNNKVDMPEHIQRLLDQCEGRNEKDNPSPGTNIIKVDKADSHSRRANEDDLDKIDRVPDENVKKLNLGTEMHEKI